MTISNQVVIAAMAFIVIFAINKRTALILAVLIAILSLSN